MIHFLSTIGVEYDLDLAPYWIKHYKEREFDTCTVFLHREKGGIAKHIQEMYSDNGFRVICIDGPYSGGRVGAFYMRNMMNHFSDNDFVVVADADEFHLSADNSPVEYRELCGQYDVLHGLFEERYADTLSACTMDPFVQYNHIEPYTGDYFKRFSPPWLEHYEWPTVYRSKILAARAKQSFRHYGIHGFYDMNCNDHVLFGMKVVHFAWREGSAKKLAKKEWYEKVTEKSDFINEVIPIDKNTLVEQFA